LARDDEIRRSDAGGDRGEVGKGKRLSRQTLLGMDRPSRRRHRGSHRRAQTAIDDLWAFTGEMFAVDDSERGLIDAGIAIDPAGLHAQWLKTISNVVREATLVLPKNDWMQQGGRSGHHSEHLGHLLSELQSLQRTFPGATW